MKARYGLLLVMLFATLLGSCKGKQKEQPAPVTPPPFAGLYPGEIRDPFWPHPIIISARDTTCSIDTTCPTKSADCIVKSFTVLKDTTYFFTLSYFNGDTINASCRACGTIYQDTTVIMQNVTACPTGGPWATFSRLRPGIIYTLAVCLQRCPQLPECRCGKRVIADGIVSIRPVFD